MRYWKGFLMVLGMLGFILSACGQTEDDSGSGDSTGEDTEMNESEETSSENGEGSNSNQSSSDFTKEDATSKLTNLGSLLQPETTEEGKVEDFETKDELVENLNQVVVEDVGEQLVEGMFEEKEDGLYVKTGEYAPFLLPEQTYTFEQVEEQSYQIVQKNKTEIYGEYKLTATFAPKDGTYLINQYDVEYKDQPKEDVTTEQTKEGDQEEDGE
ncbi:MULTISPECIES: hypothetical protein [Pontibacillus]|uniref:Lipoprotein n=1 Tax=Pontibacillus chungwhensis TaxID=265426 RepID=A0ABY8UUQ2_9BACI|nr:MULTISPECIES: hypothetical protein [Pontibacillus]MCD5325148.1 hypothetical protein [Pontibacillus sp. HN14]WIF97397.1 hypothetical protein QNI29_16925 [Pontibacillus chungwhensis]